MLLHELDEDKNPARYYVLGNEYIGLDHNYYLTDEQGSVRYVLDAAGNVQNDYWYDAFGQCIAGHENIPNRLRYNAQIEDDLTGLYYLRARYYNTGIGRFTQEDVIYNDGLNLYAYCSSNPVMYEDPSGYAGKSIKKKICGSKEGDSDAIVEVNLSKSKYPESVKHIEDSIANGYPEILTIDRSSAKNNRRASLKGIDKIPGKDLDEYPPAMSREGGKGASMRGINSSDNRGSGSSAGDQLRGYPNGTKYRYNITK